MTAAMMARSPDLDFLYYSNDMIGAGGLLHLLSNGADIPEGIGLAAFNGVDLLDGLPLQLATMDACRREIGQRSAKLLIERLAGAAAEEKPVVQLDPKISFGDTLRAPR